MDDKELDVILFDYRGLRFTFRLRPPELDANGDPISDMYFADGGTLRSRRFDELMEYGNLIAAALPASPAPSPHPPQPSDRAALARTNYAPPPQAQETCPVCGAAGRVIKKNWGNILECTNPQCLDQAKDGRWWPHKIRNL